MPINQTQKLQAKLHKLQINCPLALAKKQSSNFRLYQLLTASYLWWREAKQIEGYLDSLYATNEIQFKTNIKSGINFNPLLKLTFGIDTISSKIADKYSKALNTVHNEFERKPALYKKDGVTKLATFIQNNGGTTELAGYAIKDKVEKPDKTFSTPTPNNTAINAELAIVARQFYEGTTELEPVALNGYVATNVDQYSLLLVKNTQTGYKWVATADDRQFIEAMLVDSYKYRFDALPASIRPLFELMQTQCLPKHLSSLVTALIDKTQLDGMGKALYKAARRVMYRYDTNELILSPVNSKSGVVSIVKTATPLLANVKTDVFLPIFLRGVIERRCLRGYDFNTFKASNLEHIPAYPFSNTASHVIHLQKHYDKNDYLHIDFWPFYDTFPTIQPQVIADENYVFTACWSSVFEPLWLQYLDDEFLTKWLNGHAKHLKRSHNELLKVTFTATELVFEYVFREGIFENKKAVSFFNANAANSSFSALFLTKDFIPVFRSLSDFAIDGNVGLAVNDDVLQLHWKTAGNEYTVYIPTATIEGKRSKAAFNRYNPVTTFDDSYYDDETYEDYDGYWHDALEVNA